MVGFGPRSRRKKLLIAVIKFDSMSPKTRSLQFPLTYYASQLNIPLGLTGFRYSKRVTQEYGLNYVRENRRGPKAWTNVVLLIYLPLAL